MKKKLGMKGLLIILILAALSGCGKDGSKEKAAEAENTEEEYVYVPEFRELELEESGVSSAYIGNDTIYYCAAKTQMGMVEKSFTLYASPIDGGEPIKLLEETGELIVSAICESGDNLLLVLTDNAVETPGIELRTISKKGEEVSRLNISEHFKQASGFYVASAETDASGNIYIRTGTGVSVLDQEGRLIAEISPGTSISSMIKTKDERVVVGCYGETGWRMEVVDVPGKKLIPLESKIKFDYGTYQSGLDTDMLYTQGSLLYTCNVNDSEPVNILDWVDSDVDSNNLQQYRILEDGRIAAFTTEFNSSDPQSEVVLLTKTKKSEAPQKTVLTYTTLYLPYYTNKDIVAFNKQSEKYRIEVKDYSAGDTDYEAAAARLNAEIADGGGGDIFDLENSATSIKTLAKQGVLEDLYPYLEKDATVKKEDILPNVLKVYEVDGKLTGVMTNFALGTLAGKASDLDGMTKWTVDEMMARIEALEDGVEILPRTTKRSMFYTLCRMNMEQFVNGETGECSFDNDSFKKILEFSNSFPLEVDYNTAGEGSMQKIRSGELFLEDTTLSSVQLYQMYEAAFGEPVVFIGYPTDKQSGTEFLANGTAVGMSALSENKEGVWEFISFLLSKERQDSNVSANGGFPVLKSSLEQRFAKESEKEYYEDADGNQQEMPKGYWGNGEISLDVFAATPEQVSAVRTMIESTEPFMIYDTMILSIIMEETQAYFEGQKKVEDVIPLIQNRVQTYVSENS